MYMLLVACIFPIFCGIGLLFYNKNTNRKLLWGTALTQVLLTAGLFATAAYENLGKPCELFSLSGQIEIVLKPDLAGLLFAVLALVVFGCAFVFSYEYMKHEKKEGRYLGFLMIALGVYLFLCCAGNLVTFYLFFEMLTVTTFPLVLHNESHAAVLAGALGSGSRELIALALRDRLHQPYREKLIPEYVKVKAAAEQCGAIAFCISGAGPTLLALTDDETFAMRYAKACEHLEHHWHIMELAVDCEGIRAI